MLSSHRFRRRGLPLLAAAVAALTIFTVLAGNQPTSADTGPPERPHREPVARGVTLITGDRVDVYSDGHVTVQRGAGRDRVNFSVRRDGKHTYVVPADAVQPLASGRLDARLFDVTGLLAAGYSDAQSGDLPLIVKQGKRSTETVPGARVTRRLPAVHGAAVKVSKKDTTFWRSLAKTDRADLADLAKVWLDGKRQVSLDRSVPQIGAPAAWAAGYTGAGVTTAVIDTGVDGDHPDLAGKVVDARNFTDDPDSLDTVGHGTHVASTIASNDATYRGVAPGTAIVSAKVCTQFGCPDSAVLAAMQWVAADKHVDVANMSLGGGDTPELDPLEEAVNTLTERYGTLFVIAAGNSGPNQGTLGSPASADAALAVGAVDKSDVLASFSSRGPRIGDAGLKPDVTAPGVDITAAQSRDSGGDPGRSHVALSGTSMATPHVAGAAALLAQQHPEWTPAQLKATLMASAKPATGVSAYDQGAGRIDLTAAIRQNVLAETPSVGFGLAQWPHDDDQPVTKTLTYRNLGGADVTLDLRVEARGPGGQTAPAGMFTLSAQRVTVPAGGTASVEVTADTRGELPDGQYTGRVVATGSGTEVGTPIGLVREKESYDVTVEFLGSDGAAARLAFLDVITHEGHPWTRRIYDTTGTVRLRLPRDRYALFGGVLEGQYQHQLVQPVLDVTRDLTVRFDARTTRPVDVAVQRNDASAYYFFAGFAISDGTGGGFLDGTFGDPASMRTAQVGPDGPKDRFLGMAQASLAKRGSDGTFDDSPYVYQLAWFSPGRAHTGTRSVRDRDLATVDTRYLAQGRPVPGATLALARSTQMQGAGIPFGVQLASRLPHSRTIHYSTEGVAWYQDLIQNQRIEGNTLVFDALQLAQWRTYQRGGTVREVWNGRTVFGPSLPGPDWMADSATQYPTFLRLTVGLFGTAPDTTGQSAVDSARTVLSRDGTVVCESASQGLCAVRGAPVAGRYRMETEATRSLTDVSTKVGLVWTWTSDGSGGDRPASLPVRVVRFTPTLDEANSAPGDSTAIVPVQVLANPGAPAAKVTSLTVDVSYDDGKTWRREPVRGHGGDGVIVLRHPTGGYVSLRAKAVDSSGSTVEQTIIRAYRLR